MVCLPLKQGTRTVPVSFAVSACCLCPLVRFYATGFPSNLLPPLSARHHEKKVRVTVLLPGIAVPLLKASG